jgi:hypothetical protein
MHRRTVRQALASAIPPPRKTYPRRRRPAIGQATGQPRPEAGTRRPAGTGHDHHNRSLHVRGEPRTSEISQPAGDVAAAVAGIVQDRNTSEFVVRLRLADQHFSDDPSFERSVAQVLQSSLELVTMWATWSGDQRWTPSAHLEGNEVGWYDGDGARRNVKVHPDTASATADFIHRLAAWLARREIL